MNDTFKGFIGEVMREHGYTDLATVVTVEEKVETGGYCDTCYYEDIVIDVTYLDIDGNEREGRIYDTLAELMREASK